MKREGNTERRLNTGRRRTNEGRESGGGERSVGEGVGASAIFRVSFSSFKVTLTL